MLSTANAIKCYVCGKTAEQAFERTKDESVNVTSLLKSIPRTCDELDKLTPHDMEAHSIECPTEHNGCMLEVHGKETSNLVLDL